MGAEDTYYTLKTESESLYKDKGSKFLSFAYRVESEDEVKEKLDHLKKKYHDARHHCFAYMIGQDQSIVRVNDGGEPNHSAGDPILGQIRSHQLSNVLIVVVRYFGGTKLGMGGLIQAYKTAALNAIENNKIITAIIKEKITVEFDYLAMNDVMKLVKEENLEVITQSFNNSCRIEILVRKSLLHKMKTELENMPKVVVTTC